MINGKIKLLGENQLIKHQNLAPPNLQHTYNKLIKAPDGHDKKQLIVNCCDRRRLFACLSVCVELENDEERANKARQAKERKGRKEERKA